MTDNFFNGLLYGPSGPDNRRVGDDNWGKLMDKAMAGNDDEGFVEKTLILGKYTFGVATGFAMADVILVNNKGGLPVALSRMKFHYVPWLGATVAYTAAVAASCSLRGGKTDHYNHVVGGFAAGAVVGKTMRSAIGGFISGAILAAFAWHYKDSRIQGYPVWTNIEKIPPRHGNPFHHKLDFTIQKQMLGNRPGYWARTPEEAEEVYKKGQLGDGRYGRLYGNDRLW